MFVTPQSVGGVGPCTQSHCSRQAGEVNKICKQNGWPVGQQVVIKGPDGTYCYCTCSCLAEGTPVAYASGQNKSIEDFQVSQSILVAGQDLKWTEGKVAEVLGTDKIGQDNVAFVTYDGGNITVTADHLFLIDENGTRTLLKAESLVAGDLLVAANGGTCAVTSVSSGEYYGSFHNVSTNSTADPSTSMDGHLINSNGIVSGDYALQTFWGTGELAAHMVHSEAHSRPTIGSLEYAALHGGQTLSDYALEQAEQAGIRLTMDPTEAGPGVLVLRQEIAGDEGVDDGVYELPMSFVPVHLNGQLEGLPMFPVSDAQRQAMVDYLTKIFGALYPDIDFRVKWWARNVNVFALRGLGKRRPRVVVNGGFARLKTLDIGAISLAMSYAVASLQSTEADSMNVGKCDYDGALVVMRNVWWMEDYFTKMEGGIEELKGLFKYIPTHFGPENGPNYPAGSCRTATYENAMSALAIPDCAILTPIVVEG